MRTVTYRLDDLKRAVIHIGRVAENEYTRVQIDAGDIYAEYPHASAALTVQPPVGEAYPAVVTRDGNLVIWDVKDSDLAYEGDGEIQLTFSSGETVAKSVIGQIHVCRSILGEGEAPDPLTDFLAEAGEALTAIPETISEAFEGITAEAETLTPGSSATASFDGETKVLTIGVPKGDKGDTGATGATGQTGPAGRDGSDGKDGKDGKDGSDGHSPVLTSSKSGKVTTIYSDGQQLAQISDGADGQGGDIIDDTAGSGDTGKTWSADKLASEVSTLNSALTGKISEPSSDGTNGQVLTTDGNGGRSWTTVQGGGGTSDYSDLTNKPSINSATLSGNKSLADLGIINVEVVRLA